MYILLSIKEIRAMYIEAPLPPLVELIPDSIGILSCSVCLDGFKPGAMVAHVDCDRFVCITDALFLIERGDHCPHCRGALTTFSDAARHEDLKTFFRKPNCNENWVFDNAKFLCQACSVVLSMKEAYEHPSKCTNTHRHTPPAHIPPRQATVHQKYEVVSNPVSASTTSQRQRLLVIYLNGRQVYSKDFYKNKTAQEVKVRLATKLGLQAQDIKLYKFIHKPIRDNLPVNAFATSSGANFIAATTRQTSPLESSIIHLLLEEIGSPPILPRPQQQQFQQLQQFQPQPQPALNNPHFVDEDGLVWD